MRKEIRHSIVTEEEEYVLCSTFHPKKRSDMFVKNPQKLDEYFHFYIDKFGKVGSVKTDEIRKKGEQNKHQRYNKRFSDLLDEIILEAGLRI